MSHGQNRATAATDSAGSTGETRTEFPAALPALGAAILAIATWLSRSSLPIDDAAITFRYATRLATGDGLTYNDGEQILGASSPLYTLILAGLRALGIAPPTAALAVGVIAAAACGALVAGLAYRLSGRAAAGVAVVLLLAGPFRTIASSGMESPMLVALTLGAIAAAGDRRDRLAGVLLGLALWTKLDAAAVVVALAAARLAVDRAVPKRLLFTAVATAAPWYLWAILVYGNPLPHSLVSKLSGRANSPDFAFDPTWALRGIVVLLPALIVATWFLLRRLPSTGDARVTHLALAGWFLIHLVATSLLPLGGQFGWYLAPLVAPLAIIAGCGTVEAVSTVRSGTWSSTEAAVVVLALVSVAVVTRSAVVDTRPGLRPTEADRAARDLRAAGRWIDEHHPGETVLTCVGWIAYEIPDHRIIDPCQITTEASAERAALVAGTEGDAELIGRCELARFDEHQGSDPDRPAIVVNGPCPAADDPGG